MIETKEQLLETLIEKAISNAKINCKSQLISFTKKIDATDPIVFFESAKQLSMNRVFWSTGLEQFTIVGVGSAVQIEANTDRFKITERKWNSLIKAALVHNPYEIPGTGVLALGGMAFDPKADQSALWKKFADSSFTVPHFVLTNKDESSYLTVNVNVRQNDHPQQLAESIRRMESDLFQISTVNTGRPHIHSAVELGVDEWKETVQLAKKSIKQNSAEKIVLAREMRIHLPESPKLSSVLLNLLENQPNSYIFAIERDGDCFIGASPERLVRLDKQQLLSTCLAGTAPRGNSPEEDAQIGKSLLHDEKNRSEHDFVVRMIHKAMEKYCITVDIPEKPILYPLKNLQHLYTPVTATLKKGYSIFDILEKLHPTPALGGVPRDASLAFIREHEGMDRGWYGAPIGWLDSNDYGEFAVAIRSGLIQEDEASIFAGCGIVKNSDPEAEYEETAIKFLPMLSVLGGQA